VGEVGQRQFAIFRFPKRAPVLHGAIEEIAGFVIQPGFDANLIAKLEMPVGLSFLFWPAGTQPVRLPAVGIAVTGEVHPALRNFRSHHFVCSIAKGAQSVKDRGDLQPVDDPVRSCLSDLRVA
jgi:hypothetical protein